MEVFVVYNGSYSDRRVVGVFSTLELAKRYVFDRSEEAERDGTSAAYVFGDHDIESMQIDDPASDSQRLDGYGKPLR